jgi:ribose transport system permease protein
MKGLFRHFGGASNRHLIVPIALLVVLLVLCAIRAPKLFSVDGIAGAVIVCAPLTLAALALTPIALVGRGGVDLSIGPLIGFINVTLVHWLVEHDVTSPILIFGYAILAAVSYQLLQAALIIYARVAPIIVTLSGYLVLTGVNLVILSRPSGTSPDWMSTWGTGTEVFSPVLTMVVIAVLGWVLWSKTAFYRQVRLTGADERTAFTSGVRIYAVRFGAHIVAGIYAALAAIAYTALIGSGDPTQGSTYTLTAVTALVLGGTSLAGGRGGGIGSVLGAICMYLISYFLSTFNFGTTSGFVTQLSYGLVLVLSLLSSLAFARLSTLRTMKGAV